MTLTLQEISDRIEIEELIVRYAHALDRDQWQLFDEVFTPDAVFDGRGAGITTETPADLVEQIGGIRAGARIGGRHFVSNIRIELDGDTATGYTEYLTDRFDRDLEDPNGAVYRPVTGFYLDDYVRTEAGWRISRRRPFIKSILPHAVTVGPPSNTFELAVANIAELAIQPGERV